MYIVLEIQANGDRASVLDPVCKSELNEAMSEYHRILSCAAISSVEKHAAVVLTETGAKVAGEYYEQPHED